MKPISRRLPIAARLLMGLIFFATGLNGFVAFLPQPKTPLPPEAIAFNTALVETGYLFQIIMAVQVLVGILLLLDLYVPLALAVIAPIIVGIITYHVFLMPSGWPMAAVVLLLEIYLAYSYREAFRPMLHARTEAGRG